MSQAGHKSAAPTPIAPAHLVVPVPRSNPPAVPPASPRRPIKVTIDGHELSVPEGTSLLEATREAGVETPTLCFLETLKPVNACRICVVEVEGSRTLVPACSRKAEDGMVVR